jgi:osmotically-inducible protein OsmY
MEMSGVPSPRCNGTARERRAGMTKSDSEIQAEVMRELAWESHVRAPDVGVTVRGGIVTLVGTIGSWAEKHAAQEAAHRVRGVLDVANDMTIKPSWNTDISDTEIARAVRGALEWNVFVPSSITSNVWDGVVRLDGVVTSLSEREDAEQAVRGLRGIRGLENHIVVEPQPVAVEHLRASIEAALERHVSREANRISIDVTGGVDSWAERKAALGAVMGTPGVRTVEDRLHITTPGNVW